MHTVRITQMCERWVTEHYGPLRSICAESYGTRQLSRIAKTYKLEACAVALSGWRLEPMTPASKAHAKNIFFFLFRHRNKGSCGLLEAEPSLPESKEEVRVHAAIRSPVWVCQKFQRRSHLESFQLRKESVLHWDGSVHFDHTVNLGHEPETGKEANCAYGQRKATISWRAWIRVWIEEDQILKSWKHH